MLIRPPLPAELPAIRALLAANGWSHRLGDAAWFERLLSASCCLVAVQDDQVVGFVRAITDGLSNGYLSMLVVAPEQRRHGIGSRLVEQVMGDDPNLTWVLRASRPGAREFFARLGFAASAEAMERPRGRHGNG